MDYQLVVVRGRSAAQALQLVDGVTTVGRHDECQLRIKSSQVSRKHCELFEKKGLLLVKDLGSANGTFVNGEKVDGQRVLEAGDELTIGNVKLRVEKKTGELSSAASPLPAAKPNDTAIGAPAADAAAVPMDDEFEIDFETEAAADDDFTVNMGVEEESDDIDALLNEPVPAPSPPPPPAAKPAAAATPAPAPEEEKGLADDAIADFLLDIKVDEDDR